MINRDSYNLEYNLRNYEGWLEIEERVKSGTEFQERKEKVGRKVMQIVALGVQKLTEAQEKSLLDFSRRNVELYPEDCVVQQLSAILSLTGRSLPNDIRIIIESFKDVNRLNSLSENQRQKVVSYAANRILKDGEQLSYADLVQFAKIITIGWKNLDNQQRTLIIKIRELMKDIPLDHGETTM